MVKGIRAYIRARRAKPLADAHRRLAEAERGVERMILDRAEGLPDPERARRRARSFSDNARVHEMCADRIDKRAEK